MILGVGTLLILIKIAQTMRLDVLSKYRIAAELSVFACGVSVCLGSIRRAYSLVDICPSLLLGDKSC